ncbi:hypothetical protein BDR03DRAFT_524905 [Suillus americanus]|nr:hypothetical protein BDR03DRAFT_524905 [Suillus americanus]
MSQQTKGGRLSGWTVRAAVRVAHVSFSLFGQLHLPLVTDFNHACFNTSIIANLRHCSHDQILWLSSTR